MKATLPRITALAGTLGISAFIVPLLALFTFHQVDTGHVGVWSKWGAVQDEVEPAGLYISMPGRTQWYDYDTRIQKLEVEARASSADLQVVTTSIALNYRIDPTCAHQIYDQIGGMEAVQSNVVAPALQEAVKASTAEYSAEELITKRPQVKQRIEEYISRTLERSHLQVTELSVQDFRFSKAFSEAVEAKEVAEQHSLTARNRLEQIKYEAQQVEERAKGEARARLERAKADAESNRLLAASVTDKVIQLRTLEKWDGSVPLVAGDGAAFVDLANLKR